MTIRTLLPTLILVSVLGCNRTETTEPGAREVAFAQTISPLVPVVNIGLEGAVSMPPLTQQELADYHLTNRRCDGWFRAGNVDQSFPLEGSICDPGNEADRPFLSTNYKYKGARSLQMSLPPRLGRTSNGSVCSGGAGCTPLPAPDRAELTVNGEGDEVHNGVGFNFNNPKYFGFAMYIPSSMGLPLQSALHFMQAWQYGVGRDETSGTCGVPLHASLVNQTAECPGSPLNFYVSTHDDSAENLGTHTVLSCKAITLDAWHTFVFYLQPNSNELPGSGVVTVWFDGVPIVDWHGDWGCNVSDEIRDKWHLRVGMYRTGAGIINQWHSLFFDNIRVASSRKQADPAEDY